MSRSSTLTDRKRLRSANGYRHPRTGERRKARQPLRIDRLPQAVKDAIIVARAAGKTWPQTAELASTSAGESLAPSTVQRWYDLRVEQDSPAAMLRRIVALLEDIREAVRS